MSIISKNNKISSTKFLTYCKKILKHTEKLLLHANSIKLLN